jgi:hypothetical protein
MVKLGAVYLYILVAVAPEMGSIKARCADNSGSITKHCNASVSPLQAQPPRLGLGLSPGLRPTALSLTHVGRQHLASSALPAHNPGLSSGEYER